MTPSLAIAAILFSVGLVAGCIDAIAGGGGLITIPSLLLLGIPPHLALGTNKAQSFVGTGMALWKFHRSGRIDVARLKVSVIPALIAASLGVLTVSYLNENILAPMVIVLLAAVAIFMLFYRPKTIRPVLKISPAKRAALSVAIATGLAFYDGFFGPGTGLFLITAYVLFFHESLDSASANAKVVNFTSNVAALACFAFAGKVVWVLALPMAVGQLAGGWIGAHLTIRKGPKIVRFLVVGLSLLLLVRLSWKLIFGG